MHNCRQVMGADLAIHPPITNHRSPISDHRLCLLATTKTCPIIHSILFLLCWDTLDAPMFSLFPWRVKCTTRFLFHPLDPPWLYHIPLTYTLCGHKSSGAVGIEMYLGIYICISTTICICSRCYSCICICICIGRRCSGDGEKFNVKGKRQTNLPQFKASFIIQLRSSWSV